MNLMNLQAVDAATGPVLDRGIRVFADLFGQDEGAHVDALLAFLDPPEGALVVDMGCGIGEVARLMVERRPDLDILLVNSSIEQLALAPDDMPRIVGDFHHVEAIPTGSADVVMFSYALCHSGDWPTALAEAYRLLKPGGLLFIIDMARLSGDNEAMARMLGARAHEPELVEFWARRAGFKLDEAAAPPVVVPRLRNLLLESEREGIVDSMLRGLVPTMWVFTALEPGIVRTLNAHEGCVAFQFSGGRDSTAALYQLREHWPKLTVYHVDTGDQFPELREVVDVVERDLAAAGVRLVRIETDVHALRIEHGYPSDLVPTENTPIGRMVSGRALPLQDRYACCARALMDPLHERMHADGMTLLIRGQRDAEYAAPPHRSGETADGFEVLYPIEAWTAYEVDAYLQKNGLPVAPFYAAGMRRAPECMGCTAWLDEGRAAYLRDRHPEQHAIFITTMATIRAEIDCSLSWLNHETEA